MNMMSDGLCSLVRLSSSTFQFVPSPMMTRTTSLIC